MIYLNSFKKNNKLILKSRSSFFFLKISERKKFRKKRVKIENSRDKITQFSKTILFSLKSFVEIFSLSFSNSIMMLLITTLTIN